MLEPLSIRGRKPKLRRGKRYLRIWNRWADGWAADYPRVEDSPMGYWHQRLGFPVEVDGRRTPNAFRREVVQTFLRAAANIRSNLPSPQYGRVLCCISRPWIVDSDLMVVFDEAYLKKFFGRRSRHQSWRILPSERSLSREWSLAIPDGFGEIGTLCKWQYDEQIEVTERWWYGDIDGVAEQLRAG